MTAELKTVGGTAAETGEHQVRADLAAFHRLYAHFGWTDLIYTHLTARVPGRPDHYFIKQDGLLMEEVSASNLLRMDLDGNLIEGDDDVNLAGHLIHSAVLRARPEINFVAHTHSRAGTAVSCMECGLLPLSQHANLLLPTVKYHEYQDVTSAEDECAALARDLEDGYLMMLYNHGILACGRTVGECFYYLYFLEMACKIQVDVLASGQKMKLASDDIVAGLFGADGAPKAEPKGTRVWSTMLRMLDRKDDSYRN